MINLLLRNTYLNKTKINMTILKSYLNLRVRHLYFFFTMKIFINYFEKILHYYLIRSLIFHKIVLIFIKTHDLKLFLVVLFKF